MGAPTRKLSTAVDVKFSSLRNCLVNLPHSLISVIAATNSPAQDVIIEILVNEASSQSAQPGPRSIYVGWSGIPCTRKPTSYIGYRSESVFASNEVGREIVEIDRDFGGLLGLAEDQRVALILHFHSPSATTVHIEPLTPGDWEIIELHANFLELNLLSQIRALPNPSASQSSSLAAQHVHPLTVHLSPTSTANIIVTALTLPQPSSKPFAKLAPDAEVIVAPKTRPKLIERRVSQSVTSAGRKSAGGRSVRSAGRDRPVSQENLASKTLLLRPCDRRFCDETFCAEDGSNSGLRIWVDPEAVQSSMWDSVIHVTISVIDPTEIRTTLDPRHQQQKITPEPDDKKNPTSSVVAELLRYDNAPSASHAILSTALCSSLRVPGIHGGIVKISAAFQPVPQRMIQSLVMFPLSGDNPDKDSIVLGGHSKSERYETLKDLEIQLRDHACTKSLLHGPLTDGLLIPSSVHQHFPWYGGILRFVWRPGSLTESEKPSVAWVTSLDMEIRLETAKGMALPPGQMAFSGTDNLPTCATLITGLESLCNEAFTNLSRASSVLLTGGLGSGKSSLAELTASRLRSRLQFYVSYVACRELMGDDVRISNVKGAIERLLTAASWAVRLGGHALVIMDDLDELCPAVTELQTHDNSRSNEVSELILTIVREYCSKSPTIVLLGTTQSKDSLNSLLIGANLFKNIIDLKAPDKDRRRRLLEVMVADADRRGDAEGDDNDHTTQHGTTIHAEPTNGSFTLSPVQSSQESMLLHSDLNHLDIAAQTDGYMPADLLLLVSRAKSEALIRSTLSSEEVSLDLRISSGDFNRAMQGFTPASLRNVALQSSRTTFDSIGGLKTTRKIILETLQYPTLYAPIFSNCPLRLRSGLLLYGFPGCGKTLLAGAVARECGLNFISVKGPEILNKYIGASEKSVRDLFERAERARPCVLFFDEFDSIAPKRGHDSTGVTDRVVNQLLTQMDGAEGLNGVYMLAATSRPDLIDPALLRPGRLDKILLCDLPDLTDRLDILTVISQRLKLEPSVLSSPQRGLYEVAQRTDGYSGADLQAIVYNAHLEAIHEELGDFRTDDEVAKKNTKARTAQHSSNFDAFRFHFGKGSDSKGASTTASHTQALIEYHAMLSKVEDIRRSSRLKRRATAEPVSARSPSNTRLSAREERGAQEVVIHWRHFEASLASTRSSIGPHERNRLRQYYNEFIIGRSGQLPNGENSTEIGGRSSLM
ncbi:MAG: hypothetical protein Q9219_006580 [cf. Caloplaca sp. 3 TL-2023]